MSDGGAAPRRPPGGARSARTAVQASAARRHAAPTVISWRHGAVQRSSTVETTRQIAACAMLLDVDESASFMLDTFVDEAEAQQPPPFVPPGAAETGGDGAPPEGPPGE